MADDELMQEDRSPWTSTGFVVSVLFLGVIIFAGILLLVFGRGDDSAAESPLVDTTQTTATTDSVCGLEPGDQELPAIAPKTEWRLFGAMYAPSVKGVGPGIADERQRRCFAHSPAGAVLFMANALVVTNRYDDWETSLLYTAYDSDELKERWRRKDATEPGTKDVAARIVGYRIASYTRKAATVELALDVSAPQGSATTATSMPLVWRDGDWKVQVSSMAPPNVSVIENLSGFVPWSEG